MSKHLLAMVKQVTADEYLSLVPRYVDFEGDKILQFTDAHGRNVVLRFAYRNEYWICYSLFEVPEDDTETDPSIMLFLAQAMQYGASLMTLEEDSSMPPEAKLMVEVAYCDTFSPLEVLQGAAEMMEATRQAEGATKQ